MSLCLFCDSSVMLIIKLPVFGPTTALNKLLSWANLKRFSMDAHEVPENLQNHRWVNFAIFNPDLNLSFRVQSSDSIRWVKLQITLSQMKGTFIPSHTTTWFWLIYANRNSKWLGSLKIFKHWKLMTQGEKCVIVDMLVQCSNLLREQKRVNHHIVWMRHCLSHMQMLFTPHQAAHTDLPAKKCIQQLRC